jgi:ferredoxin
MERRFGPFTVRIDPTLCVGFGDCITEAAEVFELAEDGIVRFLDDAPADLAFARLDAACRVCPVDALSLHDENQAQLAP